MIEVEVRGLDEVLRRLEPDVLNKPLEDFLKEVGRFLVTEAQRTSPHDTGRLMTSLNPGDQGSIYQLDSGRPPLWIRVGTNVGSNEKFKSSFGTVSYPQYLDLSPLTHYRGTPRRGQPTKGWFTDTMAEKVQQTERFIDELADALVTAMGG